MVGDSSWAMWVRTANFLAGLTGIGISVPSGPFSCRSQDIEMSLKC